MTRIAERKTTLRAETSASYRGRALVILAEPHDCVIRERGRRHTVSVPWVAIYQMGHKLAALEARKLKLEQRRSRA